MIRGSYRLDMTRRIDHVTAEKVSLVLLAHAAFGKEAALRNALLSGLSPALIEQIFSRARGKVRTEVQGVDTIKERRQQQRPLM